MSASKAYINKILNHKFETPELKAKAFSIAVDIIEVERRKAEDNQKKKS